MASLPLLEGPPTTLVVGGIAAVVIVFLLVFIATRFKRCPSNKVLVIYGKVGAEKSANCIHGGGKFVLPLIQDYAYLDLAPRTIEIDLIGALSQKNIRVNVPSTFTVGISTRETIMNAAAERLLGLNDSQIRNQAQDIILGQMRLVIATLSIEEINQDREKFLSLVNLNVGTELNKIGLEVINVNIRDITDESGYIEAIGKKAAAEAVNQARIEVAEAEQKGAIGESQATREREVRVAEEQSLNEQGVKSAEKERRIAVAAMEAEAIEGQKRADRDQMIAVAGLDAEAERGAKEAEASKRVAVAAFEAEAIEGENASRAKVAETNSALAEKEADARRRADVARAEAERAILEAEKERETARLMKEQIAQEEIEKQKVELEAAADAERIKILADGEAQATLARKTAEAEGEKRILDAKAAGYRNLIKACGGDGQLAPTLLMIEKIEEIVGRQVEAISNLKIDKITVWDGGQGAGGERGGTAGFLSGLMGSLPPMHDLAAQAGIELPSFLGRVEAEEAVDAAPAPSTADGESGDASPRGEEG